MGTAELLTTFGIAIALAMDAFAVSIGLGLCGGHENAHCRGARVGAYFGLFQTGMTLAGYALGWAVSGCLGSVSRYASAALLGIIGGHMLVDALRRREPECEGSPSADAGAGAARSDPGRGWKLLLLAIATSIDAFGVGISLALIDAEVVLASVIIGVVAAVLSYAAVALACRFAGSRGRTSREAEVVGALVIIGIGVRVLFASG